MKNKIIYGIGTVMLAAITYFAGFYIAKIRYEKSMKEKQNQIMLLETEKDSLARVVDTRNLYISFLEEKSDLAAQIESLKVNQKNLTSLLKKKPKAPKTKEKKKDPYEGLPIKERIYKMVMENDTAEYRRLKEEILKKIKKK